MYSYVELTRPYPPILDLAARLVAENNMGGVSVWIWREGMIRDVPIEKLNTALAENIDLSTPDKIAWGLADAYREESFYRPTVRFMDESRSDMFAAWLREKTSGQ